MGQDGMDLLRGGVSGSNGLTLDNPFFPFPFPFLFLFLPNLNCISHE